MYIYILYMHHYLYVNIHTFRCIYINTLMNLGVTIPYKLDGPTTDGNKTCDNGVCHMATKRQKFIHQVDGIQLTISSKLVGFIVFN